MLEIRRLTEIYGQDLKSRPEAVPRNRFGMNKAKVQRDRYSGFLPQEKCQHTEQMEH